jgi:Uma2 family endonuclease
VATRSQMTADDYLAWERDQLDKHEFFHGEVFAMAGGSPRHNELCGNVLSSLKVQLRTRGCSVLSSDQRVSFMGRTRYVYPDVTVTCGSLELEAGDVLLNPQVLVEVLSAGTEQYDRGLKWEGYQRIASLTDYVLVSQAEPRIEHFRRASDGSWTYRAAETGGQAVLASSATLVVDDIFAGVFDLPGD